MFYFIINQRLDIVGEARPRLTRFVNGRSFLLWEVLRLDHSSLGWLSKTPDTWHEDADFMSLFKFVNNFSVQPSSPAWSTARIGRNIGERTK